MRAPGDEDYICLTTEGGDGVFDTLWEELEDGITDELRKEAMEKYGLDLVAEGEHRVVFIDVRGENVQAQNVCAIKIHKHKETKRNELAYENLEKVSAGLRKYMLPITDMGDDFKWLVFPRVGGSPTNEQMYELERAFIEDGWSPEYIRNNNVALAHDRPILINYGFKLKPIDLDRTSKSEKLDNAKWKWDVE